MTTFGKWVRGVFAGFIGGGAGAISVMVVDPARFNLFQGGAKELAAVALVQGIVGAALYLKEHPLPEENDDDV